ncbi:MAG TPA: glycosyltransferase family 39 protein, partial [Candidatus Solibacter sp.]|nr:glycosyltransferase family 39 protein [Candidatus Solibacter sp.]
PPPLARLASALGPYLAGARPMHTQNQDEEGVNVLYRSGDPGGMLTRMRVGMLPFYVLAAAMVYLWARRHFGPAVAVLSTALYTIVPTVLAHAGLATTDIPLAGCFTAAFFAMLLWAEEPTWLHSAVFGLVTGLAVVCKFTVLGFLPAAAVFAAIAWFAVTRPGVDGAVAAAKSRVLPALAAILSGALTIWAVYSFSFGKPYVYSLSTGKPYGWGFPVPAPSLFEGISFALYHNGKGHAAYFMGEIRNTGWWYFFPVLLLIKTPIAWLVLTLIGLVVSLGRRAQLAYWMPIAFAAGVLIPSITSHVNIGLRHILPIYSGLAIIAGIGLHRLLELQPSRVWAATLAALLPLWAIGSGLLQHPNYLAYFNEFVGEHPERIVVDSDLDWGQDTIRLKRRLQQIGANQVNFFTLNLTPERLMIWPALPNVRTIKAIEPLEGWTAVSPTIAAVDQYGLRHQFPQLRPWFTYIEPRERVGALSLYYVPPGSLPNAR